MTIDDTRKTVEILNQARALSTPGPTRAAVAEEAMRCGGYLGLSQWTEARACADHALDMARGLATLVVGN